MSNINIRKLVLFTFAASAFFTLAISVRADALDELRKKMSEKRQAIGEIEQRIKEFKNSIAVKQSQATTLKGQIEVINDGVQSLTLEIDKTDAQISELADEMAVLKEEMNLVEAKIDQQQAILGEYMRTLQSLDSLKSVQAFFKYASLSQAITEMRSLYRAEQNSQITLDNIRQLQLTLKERESVFTDLKRELEGLKARQVSQKSILNQQQAAKNRLLDLTRSQELEYNKLLSRSVAEQKMVDAEIARLDSAIRLELERQGYKKLTGVGKLDWPIDAIFGVSCGFHCSGYPYASLIGPHTGTDLPIDTGTPIKAAADAYVGKVHISSGAGYSYILLIHGDGISTIYGHVSNATVNEGAYVTRGQVIGHTGGAPGTRGSGLSTGPHLHFEVRKSGIPVDAINYLGS